MKSFFVILLLLIITPAITGKGQDQQVVPFTLADRDRINRIEIKLDDLETKMNTRFEALESKTNARLEALESKTNARFEALESKVDTQFEVVFWILGVIVVLNLFILGFTIWDRRTAIRPALDRATSADEKSRAAITILREIAKKDPEIAEKMKLLGLL